MLAKTSLPNEIFLFKRTQGFLEQGLVGCKSQPQFYINGDYRHLVLCVELINQNFSGLNAVFKIRSLRGGAIND